MTATIISITPSSNDGSTVSFTVVVTFADTTSGFSVTKTYLFPIGTTQSQAVATITADGTAFKNALTTISNLTSKVGTVINI